MADEKKIAEKVLNPFDLKEGTPGVRVYRIDHGTLKHRINPKPLPSGAIATQPVLIEAGELVLLKDAWVKRVDAHGNRFIDPKLAWVHPNKRRDPAADKLVRENDQLKARVAELEKGFKASVYK